MITSHQQIHSQLAPQRAHRLCHVMGRSQAPPCAGDIGIFTAAKLAPLRRVRQAHMVFVTALTFAPDESALLTVSADASARATLVATPSRLPLQAPGSRLAVLVATMSVLLLAWLVQWWSPQLQQRWPR